MGIIFLIKKKKKTRVGLYSFFHSGTFTERLLFYSIGLGGVDIAMTKTGKALDLRDLPFQWEDGPIRNPPALKLYDHSKLQVITHSSIHDVPKGRKQIVNLFSTVCQLHFTHYAQYGGNKTWCSQFGILAVPQEIKQGWPMTSKFHS